MWQRLKKAGMNGTRAGLAVNGSVVAFARVQQQKDGRLQVNAATVDSTGEPDSWAKRLRAQFEGSSTAGSHISSVLPDGGYQLLLIEVPNVPADEVNEAVRWQIKDLLDYPAAETAIEVFDMPGQKNAGDKNMAYAVATRRSDIQDHIQLIHGAGFTPEVINIPELCVRNVAVQLPQDASGVAFLHLHEDHGTLTVSKQGVLYLIRRLQKGRREVVSASADDFTRAEMISTLSLEIQRSLDYYESHFDCGQLTELVLSPGSDVDGLAESLNEQLGLTVNQLDLGQLFDMQSAVSLEEQGDCLIAIGAALRTAPLAA